MKRIGTYRLIKSFGEEYKAYVPLSLPIPIDLESLLFLMESAITAISKLNAVSDMVPNKSLFLYMYVRKEAMLSSKIEGTQSSLSDLILFENGQKTSVTIDDVEEVSNYVAAINHGISKIDEGYPISLRLIRDIHRILLRGGRGAKKLPGEFRSSQNWIGGTRPGNAIFVPPSPENLMDYLGNLEKFINNDKDNFPAIIKVGIVHLQFETLHPFLDGNGRIGRLLIILILYKNRILNNPILYLSLYFKENQNDYYRLLQETRSNGTWETWIEFFITGIKEVAIDAVLKIEQINDLFEKCVEVINKVGRSRTSVLETFRYMMKAPKTDVPNLARVLNISQPTARNSLNKLTEIGILQETSGLKRDKTYEFKKYLDLLEA